MGTVIVSDYGIALVLATGDNKLIATVTKELSKKRPLGAFEHRICRLSYMIIGMVIVMVASVLIIQGTF
jgi:P-type Mg2+ transporter